MNLPDRRVIFDLDGTLIDSRPGILSGLRHALGSLGHDLPPDLDLDWAIGPPLDEVMARLLSPRGDVRVEAAVLAYREHYGRLGLFDARLYEGIAPLLAELSSSGRTLFIGTSKLAPFARRVAEHFGLAHHFRGVFGSEADGRFRRKADLIRRILDEHRLAPSEVVMVGDREHDVLGARALGVPVVSVTYGYGTAEELLAAGATVLCDSPDQLRGHL
jgi:phosphoglycolate phosphatase